jgi:hypothetical protein
VYHIDHGYLKIVNIGYEDGKKMGFECKKYEKGIEKDAEVVFMREETVALSD